MINKNKICFFQNSNKTENPEVNLNKKQRKHKCTMLEKRNNNAHDGEKSFGNAVQLYLYTTELINILVIYNFLLKLKMPRQ